MKRNRLKIFSRKRFKGSAAGMAISLLFILVAVLINFVSIDSTLFKLSAKRIYLPLSGSTLSSQSKLIAAITESIQNNYVDDSKIYDVDHFKRFLRYLGTKLSIEIEESEDGISLSMDELEWFTPKKIDLDRDTFMEVMAELQLFVEKLLQSKKLSSETLSKYEDDDSIIDQSTRIVLSAFLETLDAHSAFLDRNAYRELKSGTEGSFGGLGVVVGIRDHILTVVEPIPGSPAQRAGLVAGDKILSINEYKTFGYPLDSLIEKLLGVAGTKARIEILKKDSQKIETLELNREQIQVDSVSSEILSFENTRIIKMKIDVFSSRTSQEVYEVLKRIKQSKYETIQGIILDLRDNPGGLLDQAIQVADLFLSEGVIVSTRGKNLEIETADKGYQETDLPLVVLMNSDSASASEIVAGALQDHERAVVVGQPSFGKGSVQTILELPGDEALKLTIARYYTPLGRSIQNVGIYPDVFLQPVYKRAKNINVLGDGRYQGERFLLNHLETDPKQNAFKESSSLALKAYYIDGGFVESLDENMDVNSTVNNPNNDIHDEELFIAKNIIYYAQKGFSPKSSALPNRSSIWMAAAVPFLSKYLAQKNDQVKRYLNDRWKISWTSSPQKFNQKLKFNVELLNDRIDHLAGTDISFKWHIENLDEQYLDRVSVFCNSEEEYFQTKEVLIGSIAPKEYRSGILKCQTSRKSINHRPEILFSVSLDGEVQSQLTKVLRPGIKPRFLKLSNVEIKSEEIFGNKNGLLEPNEGLSIELKFDSKTIKHLNKATVRWINLSGSEFKMEGRDRVTMDNLREGKSSQILFRYEPVHERGFDKDHLEIGVVIDSDGLLEPFYERFQYPVQKKFSQDLITH